MKRKEEEEDRREREWERLGVVVHGCDGAHSWWCTCMVLALETLGVPYMEGYPKRKKMAQSQPTKINNNQGER